MRSVVRGLEHELYTTTFPRDDPLGDRLDFGVVIDVTAKVHEQCGRPPVTVAPRTHGPLDGDPGGTGKGRTFEGEEGTDAEHGDEHETAKRGALHTLQDAAWREALTERSIRFSTCSSCRP